MGKRERDQSTPISRVSEEASREPTQTPKKDSKKPKHVPEFVLSEEAKDGVKNDKNPFVTYQSRIVRLLYTGEKVLKPDGVIKEVSKVAMGQYVVLTKQTRTVTFTKNYGIEPGDVKFISPAIRASNVFEMLSALAPKKRTKLEVASVFLDLQTKHTLHDIAHQIVDTKDAELYLFFLKHHEAMRQFANYCQY